MATAFKSLDYTVPFTLKPQPNIRVVWNATTAVSRALADQPVAQATLEQLAIGDLARGVIATAHRLLSPAMYVAFLGWGETASHLSTLYQDDDEGERRSEACARAIHAIADIAPANPHDLALKHYLFAIEVADCNCMGPLTCQDMEGEYNIDVLARGLGTDIVPASPVTQQIDDLGRKAASWSTERLAWDLVIGRAITSAFTTARLLGTRDEERRPAEASLFEIWQHGPHRAWQRQMDRYTTASADLARYDRDVHAPFFADEDRDEAEADQIQAVYDDLVSKAYDEVEALYLLPAPDPAELATKLRLFREREGFHQREVKGFVDQLAADARRLSHPDAVAHDPHRHWLQQRNELIERLDSATENDVEDAQGIADLNQIDGLILETPASTKDGLLAQLLLAAQVTVEGQELAEDSARALVRSAQRLIGVGYIAGQEKAA